MTEKYFQLNDEIFIFHPDTHDVLRVDPQCIEPINHTEMIKMLRLRAVEITRQQAEHIMPSLELMHCPSA